MLPSIEALAQDYLGSGLVPAHEAWKTSDQVWLEEREKQWFELEKRLKHDHMSHHRYDKV